MKKLLISLVLLNCAFAVFSAVGSPQASPAVSDPLVNNKYFTESIKYNNLAKLAFADGQYDQSLSFSAESVRLARLSDEYITQRLLIAAANRKIKEAEARLGWADRVRAQTYYPKEFTAAKEYFNEAIVARAASEWDAALSNAINVVESLAGVKAQVEIKPVIAPDAQTAAVDSDGLPLLPAQYTVRSWDTFGDCFWNIAGRSWVYNNSFKWPILYRANRQKLPDPDNPNLIKPGMVLDIPSIYGEKREGMWDSAMKYSPVSGR